MTNLGLKVSVIDDPLLLSIMKGLIFINDDVRPTWIGPGYGFTNIDFYKPTANWANQHWGLYYGFIKGIDTETRNKQKNILDLGCGVGFCTINLTEIYPNAKITGYDIDDVVTGFAEEYNANNSIEYIVDDSMTCSLPKDIDSIFMVEILEHIKHSYHYDLLDKCLDALKDESSRLFISTPNEQVQNPSQFNKDRGHVGILTNEYFNQFKERYKSQIVSIEYYNSDNLSLTEPEEYTLTNPNDFNRSHFKIVMKK